MWSSGPISHGQFSGKAWREQVITRQPAAEKRFTVACPMPRLAPVSSKVRRGWLVFELGMVRFTDYVMTGFMQGIHVFSSSLDKTWMAGTSPAMTAYLTGTSAPCSTAHRAR